MLDSWSEHNTSGEQIKNKNGTHPHFRNGGASEHGNSGCRKKLQPGG
jgi:hypothetical protein